MLKKMCKKCCHSKCTDTAQLILRIGVGVIFVYHGFDKLFGAGNMEKFTGMLAGLHFPIPAFFAYLVGAIEFFGGIAMLLGIFTDITAILLAIIMVVAFIVLKSQKGWPLPVGDLNITLLAASLAIFFGGPGKFSVLKKSTHGASCACAKDGKPTDKNTDQTEKIDESALSEEPPKVE